MGVRIYLLNTFRRNKGVIMKKKYDVITIHRTAYYTEKGYEDAQNIVMDNGYDCRSDEEIMDDLIVFVKELK